MVGGTNGIDHCAEKFSIHTPNIVTDNCVGQFVAWMAITHMQCMHVYVDIWVYKFLQIGTC